MKWNWNVQVGAEECYQNSPLVERLLKGSTAFCLKNKFLFRNLHFCQMENMNRFLFLKPMHFRGPRTALGYRKYLFNTLLIFPDAPLGDTDFYSITIRIYLEKKLKVGKIKQILYHKAQNGSM